MELFLVKVVLEVHQLFFSLAKLNALDVQPLDSLSRYVRFCVFDSGGGDFLEIYQSSRCNGTTLYGLRLLACLRMTSHSLGTEMGVDCFAKLMAACMESASICV